MKNFLLILAVSLSVSSVRAQNNFTLNPLVAFGVNGDGSIRPGDQPWVSAQGGVGTQIGDLPGSTNGFNQRGLSFDPVSGHLVYVDTHAGSGGSAALVPNAAIYILDSTNGNVVTTLNLTGI